MRARKLFYFSGGHFANPYKCENGTYRGHQLGGWDLELLPLLDASLVLWCGIGTLWLLLVLLCTVPYGFLSTSQYFTIACVYSNTIAGEQLPTYTTQ